MDQETQATLEAILKLDPEALNEDQVNFLNARRSYLNGEQRRIFASVLIDGGEKPSVAQPQEVLTTEENTTPEAPATEVVVNLEEPIEAPQEETVVEEPQLEPTPETPEEPKQEEPVEAERDPIAEAILEAKDAVTPEPIVEPVEAAADDDDYSGGAADPDAQ